MWLHNDIYYVTLVSCLKKQQLPAVFEQFIAGGINLSEQSNIYTTTVSNVKSYFHLNNNLLQAKVGILSQSLWTTQFWNKKYLKLAHVHKCLSLWDIFQNFIEANKSVLALSKSWVLLSKSYTCSSRLFVYNDHNI